MCRKEQGVHIKAVSDLLRHSSIAITGDVYGHTSGRHRRRRNHRAGWTARAMNAPRLSNGILAEG